MTSSAFLTWANSGSEPKARGAGQTAGPRGPVRAAAATPGAAHEIADKASPAKANRTTALSRLRGIILTTPPPAPIDDLSGLATPGLAGHGRATPGRLLRRQPWPKKNYPKPPQDTQQKQPIPRSRPDRLATTVNDSHAPTTNAPSRCTWATWPPRRTPRAMRTNVPPGRGGHCSSQGVVGRLQGSDGLAELQHAAVANEWMGLHDANR